MTQTDHVVLVDKNGNVSGQKEKLEAHITGELHQAFSVMLYRQSATGGYEYLLQQRAHGKYHSGGLWTNSCCSHPRLNEGLERACIRRLKEELGITQPVSLREVGVFCYHAHLDNNLIEHERDHVWVGEVTELAINPTPSEVMHYRWWPAEEIESTLASHPETFTAWFAEVFEMARDSIQVTP